MLTAHVDLKTPRTGKVSEEFTPEPLKRQPTPAELDEAIFITLTQDFLSKACTVKAAKQCRGEKYTAVCHCLVAQAAHFTTDMQTRDGEALEFYRCPATSLQVKVGRLAEGVEEDSPRDTRKVIELYPLTVEDSALMGKITRLFDSDEHNELARMLPVTIRYHKP